jgi:hypothetical protein
MKTKHNFENFWLPILLLLPIIVGISITLILALIITAKNTHCSSKYGSDYQYYTKSKTVPKCYNTKSKLELLNYD